MTNTFCPRPWIHQHITTNGGIRLCCVAVNEKIEYNAKDANLKEAFNSELLKRVRKTILAGEWAPECATCQREEKVGISTARLNEIKDWGDKFTYDDAVATTNEDGTVDYGPRYLDLRFGNFCNLKCRMCRPTLSHSWYEEWAEYHKTEGFHDSHGYVALIRNSNGRLVTQDYDWHNSEIFWNQLEQSVDFLEYVFMAGGEPLLIERHENFLKLCIDKGRADKIILAYNTNLSTIPSRLIEYWKKFKLVRIGASIDGMGEVLEYQRYPIKWEPTLRNLEKLNDITAQHPNILSAITATVTIYNVFHLPEFMWWKLHESGLTSINNIEQFPVIMSHVAHTPVEMNIQVLPRHIKDQVQEHYAKWIEKFSGNYHAIKILEDTLNFMNADDKSQHLDEFARITKFLDKSRGQDLKKVVPQLANLI